MPNPNRPPPTPDPRRPQPLTVAGALTLTHILPPPPDPGLPPDFRARFARIETKVDAILRAVVTDPAALEALRVSLEAGADALQATVDANR